MSTVDLSNPYAGSNEPLRTEEIQQINRLLSDPSQFPREFRRWVTDHASDSVDITKSQVHGLINSNGQIVFTQAAWEPLAAALVGLILPFPSTTPPKGWLVCDGTAYKKTDYPELFAIIGTAFNLVATNPTDFRVPDLQGRTIYGYDPAGGTSRCLFTQNDGAQPGGRGPSHHHTQPNHQHGMSHTHGISFQTGDEGGHYHYVSGYLFNFQGGGTAGVGLQTGSPTGDTAQSKAGSAHSHSVSGNTGAASASQTSPGGNDNTSGSPLTDFAGYMALNYIIAGGKLVE